MKKAFVTILILSVFFIITTGSKQDEPGAIFIESPYCSNRSINTLPKWLIIQGSYGQSSQALIEEYQNGTSGRQNSVHYIVDIDGNIIQMVSESNVAFIDLALKTGADSWWRFHQHFVGGNLNELVIGIVFIKTSTANESPLTQQQIKSGWRLISNILNRNKFIKPEYATNFGGIIGKFSIDPISGADNPGNFDWADLFSYLSPNSSSSPVCILSANIILNRQGESIQLWSKPTNLSINVKSISQHQVISVTRRVYGLNSTEDWFEINDGNYVSSKLVTVRAGQPEWCSRELPICPICTGNSTYNECRFGRNKQFLQKCNENNTLVGYGLPYMYCMISIKTFSPSNNKVERMCQGSLSPLKPECSEIVLKDGHFEQNCICKKDNLACEPLYSDRQLSSACSNWQIGYILEIFFSVIIIVLSIGWSVYYFMVKFKITC